MNPDARRSSSPGPTRPGSTSGAPLAGTSPRTLPLSPADTPADNAPTISAAVSPPAPAPPNGATLNDGPCGHPTTITAADGNASVALGARVPPSMTALPTPTRDAASSAPTPRPWDLPTLSPTPRGQDPASSGRERHRLPHAHLLRLRLARIARLWLSAACFRDFIFALFRALTPVRSGVYRTARLPRPPS